MQGINYLRAAVNAIYFEFAGSQFIKYLFAKETILFNTEDENIAGKNPNV